jgi:glycosyltransferase involved in cell wall biosynthesis
MRILYVSNGSNFSGAGGMEYHLIDITGRLREKGVDVALAVRQGTFFERNLLRDRERVYPLSWTGWKKGYAFFQAGKAMLEFSPDIISINREQDIARIYSIARIAGMFRKNRPKIVSVFHNLGWRGNFDLRKLDGLIFPNDYIRQDYVKSNHVPEDRSEIIYHGIDLPDVDPSVKLDPARERRFFKGAGYPLIGMVGEFRKNQSELVDVAHCLKERNVGFTMALVGRGTEEQVRPIREKIGRMGLSENFIFTGMVDRSRMPDVFHDLDISVTTHRSEPFGMVFIESIASWTPMVAYNSGGPVEVLQKGGGILVDGGPAEMAEALARVIADDGLRRSLAESGRRAAERHFSIDAMGEGHYRFYRKVLESASIR